MFAADRANNFMTSVPILPSCDVNSQKPPCFEITLTPSGLLLCFTDSGKSPGPHQSVVSLANLEEREPAMAGGRKIKVLKGRYLGGLMVG